LLKECGGKLKDIKILRGQFVSRQNKEYKYSFSSFLKANNIVERRS